MKFIYDQVPVDKTTKYRYIKQYYTALHTEYTKSQESIDEEVS